MTTGNSSINSDELVTFVYGQTPSKPNRKLTISIHKYTEKSRDFVGTNDANKVAFNDYFTTVVESETPIMRYKTGNFSDVSCRFASLSADWFADSHANFEESSEGKAFNFDDMWIRCINKMDKRTRESSAGFDVSAAEFRETLTLVKSVAAIMSKPAETLTNLVKGYTGVLQKEANASQKKWTKAKKSEYARLAAKNTARSSERGVVFRSEIGPKVGKSGKRSKVYFAPKDLAKDNNLRKINNAQARSYADNQGYKAEACRTIAELTNQLIDDISQLWLVSQLAVVPLVNDLDATYHEELKRDNYNAENSNAISTVKLRTAVSCKLITTAKDTWFTRTTTDSHRLICFARQKIDLKGHPPAAIDNLGFRSASSELRRYTMKFGSEVEKAKIATDRAFHHVCNEKGVLLNNTSVIDYATRNRAIIEGVVNAIPLSFVVDWATPITKYLHARSTMLDSYFSIIGYGHLHSVIQEPGTRSATVTSGINNENYDTWDLLSGYYKKVEYERSSKIPEVKYPTAINTNFLDSTWKEITALALVYQRGLKG